MAVATATPAVHPRGTPLLGLKLGACSCLVIAADRGRPELGDELSLPPRTQPDQGYAPAGHRAAPKAVEERHLAPQAAFQSSLADKDAPAPQREAVLDSRQEPAAVPRAEQLPPRGVSEKVAPPLGPVGCGGWHIEEDMTEDMRQVRKQAVEQYEREERRRVSQWHLSFLTSATLVNYVNPIATNHLVTTLKRRTQNEDVLTARKDIYLGNSYRAIGWDGEGTTIIAQEWCTMRKSASYLMDQVDYVGWTAMDLNKPGANGFIAFVDFGGGYNPWYLVNPRPILALAGMIEGQWRRRLKAAYMVEMPASFERFLNFFLRCIKDTTREKFHFIATPEDAVAMLREKGCDEETVAACRASMAMRRQSGKTQEWFPIVDHPFFKEKLADLGWNQDLLHLTEKHHLRLREAIQQFRVWKWGVPEASARIAEPGSAAAAPAAVTAAAVATAAGERRRGGGESQAAAAAAVATAATPGAAAVGTVGAGNDQGVPLLGGDAQGRRKARPRSAFKRLLSCLVCGACGK